MNKKYVANEITKRDVMESEELAAASKKVKRALKKPSPKKEMPSSDKIGEQAEVLEQNSSNMGIHESSD